MEAWQGSSIRISGVQPKVQGYEVEICKICYWNDGSKVASDWVKTTLDLPETPSLPTFVCGAPYTYPTISCSPSIQNPNANIPSLNIGGFPIEIINIYAVVDSDNKIKWSGTGLAPLPFGNGTLVKVQWSNVVINTDYKICQGEVTGISDDPSNYPDLNPGPIAFGGEICLPLPSSPGFGPNGIHNVTGLPWDPNGFGPNGEYVKQPPYPGYQPGFPLDTTGQYDPNGFDVNGVNAITGTQFNPEGCSAAGLTASQQPCNPNIPPYSWMDPTNSNAPTQAGMQFVSENQDSIGIILQSILNTLSTHAQDSIDAQNTLCEGIRSQMNTLVTTLQLEPTFLFGADQEYFLLGMSQHFTTRPEPLAGNFAPGQRKPQMKVLETKHIDLYDCDKKQYVFIHIKEIISAFLGSDFADLKQLILDRIAQQPQSQIDRFINEPAYFLTWLTDQVKLSVQGEYIQQYGSGLGAMDDPAQPYIDVAERQPVYHEEVNPAYSPTSGWLAAGDFNDEISHQLLAQAMEVRPEDAAFEYLQGFQTVNGIDRAYYMEAMSTARRDNVWTQAHAELMPIEVANIGSDGRTYRVYLDNIHFKVGQPATLDAYILIELPNTGQKIVFKSLNVPFTPFGLTTDSVKIQLATDVYMRLNNVSRLKLLAGNKTFVAFNCSGFAGLGIAADVELCRSVVIPYNPATGDLLPEPNRVHGHLETYAPNFSEIMVSFSMDPFVIAGVEDVKWQINQVTLDMSETVSPVGAPPQGYNTPFANGCGFKPLWKGFYVKDIQVTLPKKFAADNMPVTLGVHDLVIDDMGVSCNVSAENILDLSRGNASGWAFSIKSFALTVLMNNISKAEFSGNIHVPIFKNQNNTSGTLAPSDCFDYSAIIQPGNFYQFTIAQPANAQYAVEIWRAGKVTLNSSSIEMTYDGAFHAVATLSGVAEFNDSTAVNPTADSSSTHVKIKIPPISFQNVEVANEAPYFSPGTWDFPSTVGASLAGFELSFSNIGMVQTAQGDPALNFTALIGITGDSTKLKAEGGFRVAGRLVDDNGRQRWRYKSFKINSVHITGSFTGVPYIEGFANFYDDDPVYGTGFRGGLSAQFEFLEASVQVVGQFGRVSGYKYFLVDALVCVGAGVIPMGPLDLRGLGGGVYHNMTRPDDSNGLPACGPSLAIPPQIGASLSGIVYTPHNHSGLGFKITAAVALATQERAFNANATFEIHFNQGGGISDIWLYGNAKFMDDLDLSGIPSFVQNAAPNNDAALSANLSIHANLHAHTLDGILQVYANVAGILTGIDNGKVVDADLHFAPGGDWYIKIGSPSHRAGMKLVVPGFGKIGKADTYLQIGNHIDGIPNLPDDIASLTGLQGERHAETTDGKGFSFGVDLELGSKNFNFLMFYAGFAIHLGFDVSVLNHGSAVCMGETQPIGINGWYAEGQIYAGIQGAVGIRVKVFGKRKEFNLLSLKVAAALEAKLPNPFWAHGAVGFEYNILGGLVKGHGNFDFEIGHQCVIMGEDILKYLPIILSTTPVNNAKSIPVFITPEVVFNFPVGDPFNFESLNGGNISYKVTLDSAKILWRNQYAIPVKLQWANDKHSVKLNPEYFLPGKDSFTLIVKVHVDSSGVTIDHEERIVKFSTSSGPSYIVPTNVAGSYPLDGQFNFYKNEITSGKGYIQLKKGQPDLFFKHDDYTTYVRFRGAGTGCIAMPLQIEGEDLWDKKIEFDLPLGFLANEQVYEMQVLDFPNADPNYGEAGGGNAPCNCSGCTLPAPTPPSSTTMLATVLNPDKGGTPPPPSGPPPAQPPTEKIIYSAYFRVSQYNTFAEKMTALETEMQNLSGHGQDTPEEAPLTINLDFTVPTGIEPFDGFETGSFLAGHGLIIIDAGLQGNNASGTWMTGVPSRFFYPYQGVMPLLGSNYAHPRTLPQNTVTMSYPPGGLKITKAEFTNGLPANYSNVTQTIRHFLPLYMNAEYSAAATIASDYLASHQSEILTAFGSDCDGANVCTCIEAKYEAFPPVVGYNQFFYDMLCKLKNDISSAPYDYPIRVTYHLPGLEQNTYNNVIKLRP